LKAAHPEPAVHDDALVAQPSPQALSVRTEFGPLGRTLGRRYFGPVRFPDSGAEALARLSHQGFVVHVMRTSGWVNYVYLDWALVTRGLPPIRATANLTHWYARPFTHLRRDATVEGRFQGARADGGSGLVFLRQSSFNTARGVQPRDDPFPALVELARRSGAPVYLVPELLVWEKWQQKVSPSLFDRLFGSPEAPGFLHSVGTFLRNYQRAQFRVGEPIDLTAFVAQAGDEPTAVLARKVRSALHHHLARETRAVFGPPRKDVDRLIDEAMRDRQFQAVVQEVARQGSRATPAVERDARRLFDAIAARFSPTVIGLAAPVLDWVFNRIYDGVEVDEAGLERAMKAGVSAPVVLTPSHKSHIDYLIMSYVLWQRGYTVPLVAAGANLSFFPLGPFLRRAGAFFLRRSFKGDALYTAVFKAYLKKLVHDGIQHEFFPEGGRSRTGKLLQPKLGLFTWLVDAVLEGARDDLLFVPVAIDYERVVEGASYTHELQGGEKKPEDLKALLTAPRVLVENYGRIHLAFHEPVSLAAMIRERGLDPRALSEEQKKGLVRVLAHRVMYGISRVSTITPHALLASALLAHRRRGVSVAELTQRIELLRRLALELGARQSRQLEGAAASPAVPGPLAEAMRMFAGEGSVRIVEARGEPIYQVEDESRPALAFYKNTLLNLVAGQVIVSAALLAAGADASLAQVRERALFLSRLFKFEFLYPVGKGFEQIFDETVEQLHALGLVVRTERTLQIGEAPAARELVQFLADLARDYLESYHLAVRLGLAVTEAGQDRKDFLKRALEVGRADFLAGTINCAEALSRTNLENALLYLIDQGLLEERERKLWPGSTPLGPVNRELQRLAG
jgi:glycerol-3-phosphate O-acyltransferase